MKIQQRPAGLPPGEWAGDHAIVIPCVCGRRYDSPRGPGHTCPHCGRRYLTLEPGPLTGEARKRLALNVKEAWARRERQFSPIPDLKTPWPCAPVPYDESSSET